MFVILFHSLLDNYKNKNPVVDQRGFAKRFLKKII